MTATETATRSETADTATVASTASHRVVKVLFHVVAIAEAITWAGLLWGMYMRYISDSSLDPVPFWGMLHGMVFIAYCVMAVVAAWRFRWRFWELLVAWVMAVPPFTTVVLEIWYSRTGRLSAKSTGSNR